MNILTVLLFAVVVCVKSLHIFFLFKNAMWQGTIEVEKAQIESLHAADKSYTFIANHLHESN